MENMDHKNIVTGVVQLIKKAEIELPIDVIRSLKQVYKLEEGIAKIQIDNILKNIEIAKKTNRPLCQDTGFQTFFVKVGKDFPFINILKDILIEGVKIATYEIPLRPNSIDAINRKNNNDCKSEYIPHITWDFTKGNSAEIIALPKGAGSENMSRLKMFNPSDGIKSVKNFIIKEVIKAGGKPCPPTIVGVGIGGNADLVLNLGKKALIRPVGVRNFDIKIAEIENDLIKKINKSGIGPMGLGGKTTVLDVHIEKSHTHPACLPVGLVIQCWANRRAKMIISADGNWEVK
jgi:fumarate hydratase subunit alpha